MNVLIGCEFSGVVREAFRQRGHNAISCDLIPSEIPGPHLQGDVRQVLADGWDLMIAFPPCTYLSRAGVRYWKLRYREQLEALTFVRQLLAAPIDRICIENPIGRINTAIRKLDQIIQPFNYGHAYRKATCLWLKNLPALTATGHIAYGLHRVGKDEGWSRTRAKDRSRTFRGVAEAMATQWG